MVLQRADRIAETTTTTGTGTYDLDGVKVGFEAFVTRITSGNTVEYCCTDGVDFEIGTGIFTDAIPDTLTRATIIVSSNSDAAVSWTAGTRDIFLTLSASRLVPGLADEIAYHTAEGILGGDPDFKFDGADVILTGKMDIGSPGVGTGLDIGEGGSYSADKGGATIVQAFSYDASASSGSRFTELTITANNTLLGDAGDRLYVGSTSKFWAARFTIGVAKTTETLLGFYWNGSALTAMSIMGILKDSVTALGTAVLEQITEQEYCTYDKDIDADWATADNVLDAIPDTTTALYWICLQVPGGGLSTPPRIDDIKVRGTDADFATGTSQLILWGKARVELHDITATFAARADEQAKITDKSISANVVAPLFELRDGQVDAVDRTFKLPNGIDTSCKLDVRLDWYTDNSGEVDFDLYYKILTQGTVIGVGESNTALVNTLITASAANALQTNDAMVTNAKIDISAMAVDDIIVFTLIRDGVSDANSGNVYPIQLVIHHTQWTAGEHV